MKKNKAEFNEYVWNLPSTPCVKKAIDNIVLPRFSDMPITGQIFDQTVITKEQTTSYDKKIFQVVIRILNGYLLHNNQLDCYAWKQSKVDNAKKRRIGVNSLQGIISLFKMLHTMKLKEEKKLLFKMFWMYRKDFLIVHTEEENRRCVEVTQELYDTGLKYAVEDYIKPDENGEATVTELHVGDRLIITSDGAYTVRKKEFELTHKF